MLRWLLAASHLLALGIGLGAVWIRGRALQQSLDTAAAFRRVFTADAGWGLAALLWISTGTWRLFGGYEKGTAYYLQNHVFWTKMGLLVLVLILELGPMVTLIGWRRQVGTGTLPDPASAPRMARVSFLQAGLIVLMVLAATAMARGYGIPAR
jgi:putative membrane protein